jgi:ABC-2 type transport system ATP-binding protein
MTASADRVIDVRGLRKSYGDAEILEGYRLRSGGHVSVLGHDPAQQQQDLKRRIGIVLQSTGVDPYLTVRETVDLYAGYYASPRDVDEVIDLVGLAAKRRTRVNKLSGGQQRRLDVAVALAGDPELLFLDEPTTGFDPNARRNAWGIVRNLADIGKTIFLTTHFMDEAQYLASRAAVIRRGEIVAEGPPDTLGGRDRMQTRVRVRTPDGTTPPAAVDGATALPDGSLELRTDEPTRVVHDLTTWALDRGTGFSVLEVSQPSLEDVYLELTGGDEETA